MRGGYENEFRVTSKRCVVDPNIDEDCCALLVQARTGVVWSNQSGGVTCSHPWIEGFCVNLPFLQGLEPSGFDGLLDIWSSWNGQEFDMEYRARELLRKTGLDQCLDFDPGYGWEWGEAWVPVLLSKGLTRSLGLQHTVVPVSAVLAYQNSD